MPRQAMKPSKVIINSSVESSEPASMCTALVTIYTNMEIKHLLIGALRSEDDVIRKGPPKSMPTFPKDLISIFYL